jgi:4-hydroxythreonine-4-phosphate dehydrogenase
MAESTTVRIGVVLGDPNGIGPELVAKLMAGLEPHRLETVVIVGDERVYRMGEQIAEVDAPIQAVARVGDPAPSGAPRLLDLPAIDPSEVCAGKVSAEAGRATLQWLRRALALVRAGDLDGLCYAPLCKEAMHLAEPARGDELSLFVQELAPTQPVGEINVLDDLWTTRVTSHVPLRQVAERITGDAVLRAIRLAHTALVEAGRAKPRIGVAGLNPHAGDGGLFGHEELDVIGPAIQQARAEGMQAEGPYPADTVFVRAQAGAFDAVVTMYHDQGQIAMKLLGFGRGITLHAGLPVPIATPSHGTAFDIAGRGRARVDALRTAFETVERMVAERRGRGSDVPTP